MKERREGREDKRKGGEREQIPVNKKVEVTPYFCRFGNPQTLKPAYKAGTWQRESDSEISAYRYVR